jgi:TP901 family phage tail tape measure protein
VLEISNRVTGPISEMQKQLRASADQWDDVSTAAKQSLSEIKSQLNIEKNDLKGYQKQVKETEKTLKELEKQKLKAAPGQTWGKIEGEIRKANKQLDQYKQSVIDTEKQIDILGQAHEKASKSSSNWANAAVVANQASELISKATSAMSFAPEIQALEANIQRMTNRSGDSLEDLTSKVYQLGSVFKEDSNQIAQSANAISKTMGISFEQALGLIEQGFEKGANLNGDMLDQLKEYGPQMKLAGVSASEMIALMAKAGKDGIFSDKALDSIKEANLSLREMGQPQIDALKGIGIEVKDLAGKTSFEAVQMITKSMEGATIQARQLVLTDIFKGAGEDAGLNFISGLNSVDLDINNIPSVKQAGSSTQEFLASLKASFATTFETISANAEVIGGTIQTIASMIPIIDALSKSTRVAKAVQWLWNAALYASPLIIFVAAVAAVVAIVWGVVEAVSWAWENFEGFRSVILGTFEVVKAFGGILVDYVINTVKNLMSGLSGMGKALYQLFTGDFKDAFETGKKAVMDLTGVTTIQQAYQGAKKVGQAWNDGYAQGASGKGSSNSIGNAIKVAMSATNGQVLTYMQNMGNLHGDSYVNAMIKKAEKWAKFLDKQNNTDIYSKKLESAKNSFLESRKSNVLDGNIIVKDKKTKGNGGINIDGSKGSNKAITMNLEIKNYFSNISSKLDVTEIANQVSAVINDRLRDAAVSL